jgi:hypothetical protein
MRGCVLKVNMRSTEALMAIIRGIEELGPNIACRIQPAPDDPLVLHVVVEQVRRDAGPKPLPLLNKDGLPFNAQ